jgi:hypothetical protein
MGVARRFGGLAEPLGGTRSCGVCRTDLGRLRRALKEAGSIEIGAANRGQRIVDTSDKTIDYGQVAVTSHVPLA